MKKSSLFAVPIVVMASLAVPGSPAFAHTPACQETVNPHGQNTPPAGSTTLPGPRGGQNEDGFYKISSNVGTPVSVVDLGSGTVFGPYASGTIVKYTRRPVRHPVPRRSGATTARRVPWRCTSPAQETWVYARSTGTRSTVWSHHRPSKASLHRHDARARG